MSRRVDTSKLRPNRQQLPEESRKPVHRFGLIAFENLRMKGLSQGFLAKQVPDASWSTFVRMLWCGAEEAGRAAVGVDGFDTGETCLAGGEIKKRSLGELVSRCDGGFTAHRDTAAALMILGRMAPLGADVGEPIPCLA